MGFGLGFQGLEVASDNFSLNTPLNFPFSQLSEFEKNMGSADTQELEELAKKEALTRYLI